MIQVIQSRLQTIKKDYWSISLEVDFEEMRPLAIVIEGRRRTTEAYWPEYKLPAAQIQRLLTSTGNAAVLAEGYRWTGCLSALPAYPNTETVAICCGPFYTLELAESMNGNQTPTVSMTLIACETPARPVLYLVDDEIDSFLHDLHEIDQTICQLQSQVQTDPTEFDKHDPLLLEFIDSNYGCID